MNFFKRPTTAIVFAFVMILLAVGIGFARRPTPAPSHTSSSWYVQDEANVLTTSGIRQLQENNQALERSMGVVIGYVTCNYGKEDLYRYAMQQGETMGLGPNDFLVVLDISGENYWLVQGSGLVELFSDDDCVSYAWAYMEQPFAQGAYTQALLSLTDALTQWYQAHYLG